MTRICFTAEDLARVRFASRPAPLQELNAAMSTLCGRDHAVLLGRWRRRLFHALPPAAAPFADLVPAGEAPAFIDIFSDDLKDGLESVRASRPELVRSELERVHAKHPSPPPRWIHRLHRGDADAWQLLSRAQHTAFETVLRPVWPLVQDLHHQEFVRYAATVAERGIGAALAALVPGSRLTDGVWHLEAPGAHDIALGGRGVVLLPTFHLTRHPVVADLPGGPLHVTYPAGPGLPLPVSAAGRSDGALAEVLGRTRLEALLLLADEHTTSGLARRLGVSNATASAHTAALRGAGLISTARAGRAVLHRRTELGSLLVHQRRSPPGRPSSNHKAAEGC
ncbi:winged helix-turn-helix transcriptional regulator [Streptomyces oryzae]|uniref:Winged helix-turn-helix transcriptional regulator n=1 Tax=Streptomyces oryzae TaxID=1434886 RepID=A0ABS3X6R6_9ACTN|nr:winged helix-turn-helix domain-containing protein [Streptomyces oryzae]MBO8191019.1 winged helix-turn-helix transcriptional regulator [Streptomyces oryzae]